MEQATKAITDFNGYNASLNVTVIIKESKDLSQLNERTLITWKIY